MGWIETPGLDMSEFWKDRRVMVTGGKGFLGSYIVRKLEERCADVFVIGADR